MELSIAWIFDHIASDWRKLNIVELVNKFNKTTAEIEGVHKIGLNLDRLSLAEITAVDSENVTVFSSEWDKEVVLPARVDAQVGQFYLIKKDGDQYRWAVLTDFHCKKEGLVPALHVQEDLCSGKWKEFVEEEDYILEIDNKSITNRPDLWSNRGFAREIAAILDVPFVSIKELTVQKKIKTFEQETLPSDDCPIAITLKDQEVGRRFAGLYCGSIKNRASSFRMAYRLMRTGNRPINLIVDATNYVMLDIGQPMHAFDASKFKRIEARLAKKGEHLTLLDDQKIELTSEDYVITDGSRPVSLAGIMGGKYSGIDAKTSSLFLESANFDATAIRRTATRFGIRTEASARFEKSLDPNQNITALVRFLKLLDDYGIAYKAAKTIVSIGKAAEPIDILVGHRAITTLLGANIASDFIVETLEKIGFSVKQSGKKNDRSYLVTVPTFRSCKDVTIKEDIVEEIARFFGYENIPYQLPKQLLKPSDLSAVMRVRVIKKVVARALRMREVYNYALYDEKLLQEMDFEPGECVAVENPVSTNRRRLVTSLIPHLFGNINQNAFEYERLRFFEWARVWNLQKNKVRECKSLAGVMFDRKHGVDFYGAKNLLIRLFEVLDMEVRWDKTKEVPVWFAQHQTAELVLGDKKIGFAGKVDKRIFGRITDGDAFLFELDGQALLDYHAPLKTYEPLAKYPGVHRDMSMLVPLSVTFNQIVKEIASTDKRVRDIALVDFFQKDEWKNKRSFTVHFVVQDESTTLTNDQADQVCNAITKQLEALGATIR